MNQKQRVHAALRQHAERGITQTDFMNYPTIDGGPPIQRVAARILELTQDGVPIEDAGTRDGNKVYRLGVVEAASDMGSAMGADAASSAPQGELFPLTFDEAIPPIRSNAIYGDTT